MQEDEHMLTFTNIHNFYKIKRKNQCNQRNQYNPVLDKIRFLLRYKCFLLSALSFLLYL